MLSNFLSLFDFPKFSFLFFHQDSLNISSTIKGFGWLMRQLILYSPVTKVFEKSLTQEGTYNAFILTPTKDARWYGWTLGKPFEGLYIDDDRHEVSFLLKFLNFKTINQRICLLRSHSTTIPKQTACWKLTRIWTSPRSPSMLSSMKSMIRGD